MKKCIVLILLVICLVISINPTKSEYVKNSSTDMYYHIDSEAFSNGMKVIVPEIVDAMMVEIEEDSITVYKSGVVDGLFYFPYIPDNIRIVALFDGMNIITGGFSIISDTCIHAYFWISDFDNLKTDNGMVLLLIR